jgi:hypothetical protein
MGIVVPETCWASNKIRNKNLCCILLAIYFHILTMMHGQNHIKFVRKIIYSTWQMNGDIWKWLQTTNLAKNCQHLTRIHIKHILHIQNTSQLNVTQYSEFRPVHVNLWDTR